MKQTIANSEKQRSQLEIDHYQLYNLLFQGRITLREYLQKLKGVEDENDRFRKL